MIGLTPDEKKVIIFLLASLALGSAVLLYKRAHPAFAPGLRDAIRELPQPAADTTVGSLGADAPADSAATAARTSKPLFTGKLDLNTANARSLERLPNIGPAMAKRIIEYRSTVGKFATVEQLGRVKGIGPKRLSQLRDHVVVEP
jgi:competence ComEA-like helix-hairpin-helix protein